MTKAINRQCCRSKERKGILTRYINLVVKGGCNRVLTIIAKTEESEESFPPQHTYLNCCHEF